MEVFVRPHVLILPSWTSDPDRPISGVFFAEQAGALGRAGLRVGFCCIEQRRLHCFTPHRLLETHFQPVWNDEGGVPTLRLRGWNTLATTLPGALLSSVLMERLVRRYIARHGTPDIIHAHGSLWAGYTAHRVSRQHGIPYVLTEHSTAFPSDTVPPRFRRYARTAFARAHRVLAVGERLRMCLDAYAPARAIDVIPNLVNTDFFTLPPQPRAIHPFTFLSIANLVPQKGMKTLLEAFATAFKG
jgi:glycosyltransferase involved in cell wall biosynthesis